MAKTGDPNPNTPLEPQAAQEFPLLEAPVTPADRLHEPSRAAAWGAVGVAAVVGAAGTAATASAQPKAEATAHVQTVGNQQITTGEFLKSAKVSAAELLKLNSKTAHPEKVGYAAEKNPAVNFTLKFFDQIKNNRASSYEGLEGGNNPPLMAFNGIAVISSDARWYSYIDPTLGKGYKAPYAGYEIGGSSYGRSPSTYRDIMAVHGLNKWSQGRVIQLRKPVIKWDGERWWVGVSNWSSGSYKSSGELDANHINQPSGQATQVDQYNWTVYDPKTVSLEQYTTRANTLSVQPFFPLYATIVPNNTDASYYIDHGMLNNFKPANGWVMAPQEIAVWQDLYFGGVDNKGYGNYKTDDGGMFISASQSKKELSGIGTRPYQLSSSTSSVVKAMIKCTAYGGVK